MCNCQKYNFKKIILYLPIVASPPPSVYNPNPDPNATIFNEIVLNNDGIGNQKSINKLQTSTSSLFTDLKLTNKIGNTSANVIIYNFEKEQDLYDSYVDIVYRLPKGNIIINLAEPLKNFGLFYGIPDNKEIKVPIKYGTGDYLNVKGYVKINTENNKSIKKITFCIKH
jgi:hypothetical protein